MTASPITTADLVHVRTLEDVVDRYGFAETLRLLAFVARKKSAYARITWEDATTSGLLDLATHAIQQTAGDDRLRAADIALGSLEF